jgi:SRSO17 transposase
LGRTANGIVSVNAYALVDNITYPLSFKIFKPRHRLKEGDIYKTKPQLAEEIIRELLAFGFKFQLVLALLFGWREWQCNWSFKRAKVKFYCSNSQ